MEQVQKMGIKSKPLSQKVLLILCLSALPYSSCGSGESNPNADQLFTEGKTLQQKGRYREALEKFERLLTVSEEAGENRRMAGVLRRMAEVHQAQANHGRAHRNYVRALKIETDVSNWVGMATTLNDLGENYRLQGDYDKALEYYRRSLSIEEEMGNLT